MENKEIGNIGETIACKFLVKRGFRIVHRNYLKKCGEIDVIAEKNDLIHFIEVKTVSRENLKIISHVDERHRPEDNVHFNKLKRLKRVIQIYLVEKYISTAWQFHVITILFDSVNREAKVEFLENLVL